jgi:hypothetical protein
VCCGKCHAAIVVGRQDPGHTRIWRKRSEIVAARHFA